MSPKVIAALTIAALVLLGFTVSVIRVPNGAKSSPELPALFTTTTLGPTPPAAGAEAGVEHLEDEGHSVPEGYTDSPIPAGQYEATFPRTRSGLDAATFENARRLAAEFVIADVTLGGREQFAGYWPQTPTPTTALANSIVIDFSTAMAVDGYPSLIRSVVLWHGKLWTGSELVQMQQSVYLSRATGRLTILKRADLPTAVVSRDPLIDGNRFVAPR